jgi:hypothetical protein
MSEDGGFQTGANSDVRNRVASSLIGHFVRGPRYHVLVDYDSDIAAPDGHTYSTASSIMSTGLS